MLKGQEDLDEQNIQVIVRQTEYTNEEAKIAYLEHDKNHLNAIKAFYGIPLKREEVRKPTINQEIYKQIRSKLAIANNAIANK
jgi:hypothetical protein